MNKTRIVKESIASLVFACEDGTIKVKLGSVVLLQGYLSVQDAKEAAELWIDRNVGLQIEY